MLEDAVEPSGADALEARVEALENALREAIRHAWYDGHEDTPYVAAWERLVGLRGSYPAPITALAPAEAARAVLERCRLPDTSEARDWLIEVLRTVS